MGIKKLNYYVKTHCAQSISVVHLSKLAGKRIAVDASIYLYKFESDDTLIENMFNMILLLKHYHVIPVFVFDGKPPPEKKDLLDERKMKRQAAQLEYNRLVQENPSDLSSIYQLKKQCVFIDKPKVDKVKSLITACGITFIDAVGEADKLCAALVAQNDVWACLSEDMDLFVYGCKRVLRYFSLLKHNVIYYNTKSILLQLGVTLQEFREICVLSGTDYNSEYHLQRTVEECFELHKEYEQGKTTTLISFYEWLVKMGKISCQEKETLHDVNEMFNLKNMDFEFSEMGDKQVDKEKIKQILEEDNFIFP